ncbi:MAG: hypothetical protein ACI81L_003093 [Verrucomicrobiales bacterium]|jgi:hypothetical protein
MERGLAILLGVACSIWILLSMARTFTFPRPERVWLTTSLFRIARHLAATAARRFQSQERRHWILGSFAPVVLLSLPLFWSIGLILSFSGIFWGIDGGSYASALELSGSSLTTLGFIEADSLLTRSVAIIEALLGLAIVALVVGFLPTFYGTFSRREVSVGRLTVRAGSPPTPLEFIVRLHRIDRLTNVSERWDEWEDWFVEVGETHTTFPALIFFRSARHDRSWLTAAETSLDTAALVTALELVRSTGGAQTLIRSGYLALREIADFFDIPPEIHPRKHDELSISREQFDTLVDELAHHGVFTNVSRDAAWTAFAGWRINYDQALQGLRRLVVDVPSHWEIDAPLTGTSSL